ncbi:Uncharacterised protein [Enterobacter cloacae]|nr:Uncharacterised protein [Enterobacter cloacae]
MLESTLLLKGTAVYRQLNFYVTHHSVKPQVRVFVKSLLMQSML